MEEIPEAMLRRDHSNADSNAVAYSVDALPQGEIGGWVYCSQTGRIRVNSNTTDSKGVYYSTY
jgi:CRP-like cAMP-binding protein